MKNVAVFLSLSNERREVFEAIRSTVLCYRKGLFHFSFSPLASPRLRLAVNEARKKTFQTLIRLRIDKFAGILKLPSLVKVNWVFAAGGKEMRSEKKKFFSAGCGICGFAYSYLGFQELIDRWISLNLFQEKTETEVLLAAGISSCNSIFEKISFDKLNQYFAYDFRNGEKECSSLKKFIVTMKIFARQLVWVRKYLHVNPFPLTFYTISNPKFVSKFSPFIDLGITEKSKLQKKMFVDKFSRGKLIRKAFVAYANVKQC